MASEPGKGRSSASGAYDLLLGAIEAANLPPGTRLREAELAARFQISRTPVREALKRLELEGLVTHEPHHGAVVSTPEYGQVVELYMMREVLEGTAARLAAQHATEVEIQVLYDMVARDRDLVLDPAALAAANRAFHQQIRNSAGNRYLSRTLETFRVSLALLAGTTLGVPGRGSASIDEHAAIVARIAARDPDGAEASAREHIRSAFRTRIAIRNALGRS